MASFRPVFKRRVSIPASVDMDGNQYSRNMSGISFSRVSAGESPWYNTTAMDYISTNELWQIWHFSMECLLTKGN